MIKPMDKIFITFCIMVIIAVITGMILDIFVWTPNRTKYVNDKCHSLNLEPAQVTERTGKTSQTMHFCVDKQHQVYWIE